MANVPGPINTSYESLSKHQSNVFNSLRRSIKKVAKMFAFGEPTQEIVLLMLKLYHENAIRNMSGVKDWVGDGKTPEKLNCMFGILQSPDGTIYVTISESPGVTGKLNKQNDVIGQSDESYLAKRRMILTLLRSANIEVKFPEASKYPELAERYPTEYLDDAAYRWRRSENPDPKVADNEWNTLTKTALINIGDEMVKPERFGVFLLNSKMGEDDIHVYDRNLRNIKTTVHFVDSIEYLMRREAVDPESGLSTLPTFRPYKKYKQFTNKKGTGKKHWYAECNNGHLCTESKLFAYNEFEDKQPAASFVAYWIGKAAPPENHIIRGYCFRTMIDIPEIIKLMIGVASEETMEALKDVKDKTTLEGIIAKDSKKKILTNIYNTYLSEIESEQHQLDALRAECDKYSKDHPYLAEKRRIRLKEPLGKIGGTTTTSPYDLVLAHAVQPCAVVCPGCFANIQDYKDGKMAFWNSRNCYYSRDSLLKGGRKTKKHRKSKAKQTRKH